MDKKVLILIICLVVLVGLVSVLMFRGRLTDVSSVFITTPSSKTKQGDAAMGWSILEEGTKALEEAVVMMNQKLQDKTPQIAFIFCASDYDEEAILEKARELLPETKIIGGNSGYGVTTPGGHFWFPTYKQSLAILGVASPDIVWGTGIASVSGISSKETAQKALQQAIEDAGKDISEKPNLVISVPTFNMNHEETIIGIGEMLGEDVPIFGSYAADRGVAGDWRIFANDKTYKNGIALAVVYTDLKIGFFKEHGFEVTEAGGTVTKAEGRRVYEIDNRPAAEVYNELIGGLLSEELENITGEGAQLSKVRITDALNPFSKVLHIPNREPYYLPAMIVEIMSDKSMVLDINISNGDQVRILRGDWEILLNRLSTTPRKAIETADIDPEKILFAFNSFCCATHYALPETERPKSSQILKGSLGEGVPFIGVCGCGIQVYEQGIGNLYTSLGNGTLIFSSE